MNNSDHLVVGQLTKKKKIASQLKYHSCFQESWNMQPHIIDVQNKTRKMCQIFFQKIHRPGKYYWLMAMGILWTFNFLYEK